MPDDPCETTSYSSSSTVIFSSCAELARLLAEEVQKPLAAPAAGAAEDSLVVDAGALGAILSDNLDSIVADNMRKNSTPREKAEGEMKAVLGILKLCRDLRVTSGKVGDSVDVRLELRLRQPEAAGTRARL